MADKVAVSSSEDKDDALLRKLKAIAETNDEPVTVIFEAPAAVCISMTARELHARFETVQKRYVHGEHVAVHIDEIPEDKIPEFSTLAHLREIHGDLVGHYLGEHRVSISFTAQDALNAYRAAASTARVVNKTKAGINRGSEAEGEIGIMRCALCGKTSQKVHPPGRFVTFTQDELDAMAKPVSLEALFSNLRRN